MAVATGVGTDDDPFELLVPGAAWSAPEDEGPRPQAAPRRGPSPLAVLCGVAVAGLAGLAVGLLVLQGDTGRTAAALEAQLRALPSPSPAAPEVLVPPPVVQPVVPSTSVFLVEPPVPEPPPPPDAEPEPLPPLLLEPSTGGNGAVLYVLGSGWVPGSELVLTYLGVDGEDTGSRATVVVDDGGTFGVDLVVEDPSERPGRHVVRATDGTRTLDAPYDAQE
jgi:hypothetical protein